MTQGAQAELFKERLAMMSLQSDLDAINIIKYRLRQPIEVIGFDAKKRLWNARAKLTDRVALAVGGNPSLLYYLIGKAQ